jgi:hypothetical protein
LKYEKIFDFSTFLPLFLEIGEVGKVREEVGWEPAIM